MSKQRILEAARKLAELFLPLYGDDETPLGPRILPGDVPSEVNRRLVDLCYAVEEDDKQTEQPIRTFWVQPSSVPEIDEEWAQFSDGWCKPTGRCRQHKPPGPGDTYIDATGMRVTINPSSDF